MEIVNRSSIENEIPDLLSDTSVWSLVPHKVSEHSAEIWTGTLFLYLRKPAISRVIVYINNTEISRVDITLDQWQRPFRRVSKRFYVLLTLYNLLPNQEYKVVFFSTTRRRCSGLRRRLASVKNGLFQYLAFSTSHQRDKRFYGFFKQLFL